MASPLLISANVRNMSAYTLATYKNAKVGLRMSSRGRAGFFEVEQSGATGTMITLCGFQPLNDIHGAIPFSQVIAINQDPLAKQGFRIAGGNFSGSTEAATMKQCDASDSTQTWIWGMS